MKKKIIVILLTVLIFISGSVLGVATVFRVNGVAVTATVLSETAKTEAKQLEEALTKAYKGESIFSTERAKADAVLAEFPYFRMTEFKRSYPDRVIVKIVEDAEVYAFEKADGGYYILGADGSILGVRDSAKNRLDGADNVIVKGMTATGEKGGTLQGDECLTSMLALCQAMDKSFVGIRRNVVSVEVLSRSPETFYLVTMREGVKMYFRNPDALTEQKAEKAIEKYLSLLDAQRMTGRIAVMDASGEVFVDYAEKDEFQ